MWQGAIAQSAGLDRQIVFHIASQPLEGALLEFSRQADVPVAIASDSLRDLHVSGVEGKLAARNALVMLLKGSGLSYSLVGSTVMVTRTTLPSDETTSSATSAVHRP
jgi:outer membrane receptor for ferric coprogen and ferric-rhodotorulic acid